MGYQITGPNGNSIFLPFAGCSYGKLGPYFKGQIGRYWSSESHISGQLDLAYRFGIDLDEIKVSESRRYNGLSVRPVSD